MDQKTKAIFRQAIEQAVRSSLAAESKAGLWYLGEVAGMELDVQWREGGLAVVSDDDGGPCAHFLVRVEECLYPEDFGG